MRNRTEEAGAVRVRPLRSIIPSLALLFVVALAGSVLRVPTVAAVGDGSAQTLRVRVMDAARNLLAEAKVTATDGDGFDVEATEQSDGVYVIEGVWTKTTLEVDHPRFVLGSFELTLPDQRMVQVEVILGKANPVAVIIDADKSVAPGGGGAGGADIGALGGRLRAADHASGTTAAAGAGGSDDCADAQQIAGDGLFFFDNSTATTDGLPDALCEAFGFDQIENDVWFCWTASVTGDVLVETCGLTGVDTRIAAYDGCTCPTGNGILACNDDTCGLQSRITFFAVQSQQYLLRIGTYPLAGGGTGSFNIQTAVTPENDLCENAIPIAVPSFTLGTTDGATIDDTFPDCGTGITSPGVWYSVMGTGNTITATTCTPFFGYDTKISVYCGTCEEPTCVAGNDDDCVGGGSGLLSTVSWCSQVGAEYLILVHGFGGQTGDFELDLSDDGVNCKATVVCLPQGACCLTGLTGECIVTTAQGCDAQGGAYQGDDTDCGGVVYPRFSDCANPFEDISGTGIEAPNASNSDDAGDIVPIGFTFNFYDDDHTNIGVTSNGYLTFGADLTDFSNDAIPNTLDPNDLIAPLWDDFNPSDAGTVHYETKGSAPNRRFIAQWTNVPQFANDDSNTFQAILFEGSNCIEFRYGNFTPEDFAGDYTIGIENQDGSDGESIPGAAVLPGDCKVICQELVKGPCAPTCPADLVVDGDVGVKDLLFLLGAWGPCDEPCPPSCPADLVEDCDVGVKDLLFLLGAWGPCPL